MAFMDLSKAAPLTNGGLGGAGDTLKPSELH